MPRRQPGPGQLALFTTEPLTVHIGAWSRLMSDYLCVMCHAMFSIFAETDMDHAGDCPGWVEPPPF